MDMGGEPNTTVCMNTIMNSFEDIILFITNGKIIAIFGML